MVQKSASRQFAFWPDYCIASSRRSLPITVRLIAFQKRDWKYYRVITTVERDTGKYHEFIAGIVYECAARVNNTGGNEQVMFPRYRVHTVVIMLLSYANVKNDWSRTKPHPLETKSI